MNVQNSTPMSIALQNSTTVNHVSTFARKSGAQSIRDVRTPKGFAIWTEKIVKIGTDLPQIN